MTPEQLYAHANEYARDAEANGKGTVYPTIREVAKKFRITQQAVEEVCNDYSGKGYMGVIVAVGGNGGYDLYETRGDCRIEAYGEE